MSKYKNRNQQDPRYIPGERHHQHPQSGAPKTHAKLAIEILPDNSVTIPLETYSFLISEHTRLEACRKILQREAYSSATMRTILDVKLDEGGAQS